MSMDWSDEPGRREIEMTRAAEALRKKPRKQLNGQQAESPENITYSQLMRRPYQEIIRFKQEHPLRWRQLCKGHPEVSIPAWHEVTMPEEQKPQQEEERKPQPPKQESHGGSYLERLEAMSLSEVQTASAEFWRGVTNEKNRQIEEKCPWLRERSLSEVQERWERDHSE